MSKLNEFKVYFDRNGKMFTVFRSSVDSRYYIGHYSSGIGMFYFVSKFGRINTIDKYGNWSTPQGYEDEEYDGQFPFSRKDDAISFAYRTGEYRAHYDKRYEEDHENEIYLDKEYERLIEREDD